MVAFLNNSLIPITSPLNTFHNLSSKQEDNINEVTITSSPSDIDVNDSSTKEIELFHNKTFNSKEEPILNGKWHLDENKRFLEGVNIYGYNWKMIQKHLLTRTLRQARSHAQKIVLKVKHYKLFDNIEGIHTIQDLMKMMKKEEDVEMILKLLNNEIRGKKKKCFNRKKNLFVVLKRWD